MPPAKAAIAPSRANCRCVIHCFKPDTKPGQAYRPDAVTVADGGGVVKRPVLGCRVVFKTGHIHRGRLAKRSAGFSLASGGSARTECRPVGCRQSTTLLPGSCPTRSRCGPRGTRPSEPILSGVRTLHTWRHKGQHGTGRTTERFACFAWFPVRCGIWRSLRWTS